MDISVIIPLFNEEESLQELFAWIKRVMDSNDFTYEVIFVNDGSTDRSWNVIEELAEKNEQVKGIKFRRNYGKSPALFCGFKEAQGDVVITMDADLQDSPDEIPGLYQMIMKEGYDLVSGYKQNRKEGDPLSKTIPTKLFNATARKVSGIHNLHDFNCGLKAYRLDVVKNIEVYGEMHRYIPYLAKNAGFARIGEKPVHHQARKFGKSKFMGWNRFVNGYLDLMTLWFLSNFGKKPMHVFGFLGSVVFFIAFLSLIGLGIDKAIDLHNGIYGHLITDSPYFFIALVAMVLGSQLFLAGFLGDLISRQNPNRNDYQIVRNKMRKIIPFVVFMVLAMVGCTSLDCPLNNTVYTKYKLMGDNKTLKDTLTISTKKIEGTDSVLINKDVKVDSFSLPMSYSQNEDVLFFEIHTLSKQVFKDTVTVSKENRSHFESVDCSPSFFHTITDVKTTHNYIDSIVINQKEVNYDASKAHFYIYFGNRN